MKKSIISKTIAALIIPALFLGSPALTLAAAGTTAGGLTSETRPAAGARLSGTAQGSAAEARGQARLTAAQTKSSAEIDKRVASLTTLISRVNGMKNISDAQKSAIASMIQSLINNLTTLKTQIAADTSTTTAKADMDSITQAYRVYALVIPQLNIVAAADRVLTIASMMNQIGAKLQARLSAGASDIPNLTALQADLADMSTKMADASNQAQAAVNEVSPLVPDQGDKTKMAANTTALKDARTKIQAAQKDLVASRKDAQTVIQALVKADKAMMKATPKPSVSATPTVTPVSSATPTSTPTPSNPTIPQVQ